MDHAMEMIWYFFSKQSKQIRLLAICILESIFFTPISYYGLNDSNMLRTFKDTQLSHKMVQMWVNFAKVSNPTPSPEEDGPLKKLVWQPYVLEKNGPSTDWLRFRVVATLWKMLPVRHGDREQCG